MCVLAGNQLFGTKVRLRVRCHVAQPDEIAEKMLLPASCANLAGVLTLAGAHIERQVRTTTCNS